MRRVYFDWAATAPPCFLPPEAVPYGNPSSAHREGRLAREALEDARSRLAAILETAPHSLYWTSGGTESNAIPIFSCFARFLKTGAECITSAIEHPSCLRNFETLQKAGIPVKYVKPDDTGHIQPEALIKVLKTCRRPGLVSLQTVNNETGAVQDCARLVAAVRENAPCPVHIHSDCVQAFGKIPLRLSEAGLDSASFSAHKLCGPRGIGLLYLKKPLDALIKGGAQEKGIRPGTENVGGALAFARCAALFAGKDALVSQYAAAEERGKRLIAALHEQKRCVLVPASRAGESPGLFSPYIIAASFKDIPGEVMARVLDEAGFAVSTGSACSTGLKQKQTLSAMGLSEKAAFETIRISQGFTTTEQDIDMLIEAIQSACLQL